MKLLIWKKGCQKLDGFNMFGKLYFYMLGRPLKVKKKKKKSGLPSYVNFLSHINWWSLQYSKKGVINLYGGMDFPK